MIPGLALQMQVSLPDYIQGWFQRQAKLLAAEGWSLPGATSSLVCLGWKRWEWPYLQQSQADCPAFPHKLCGTKGVEKEKHIPGGTHSAAATQLNFACPRVKTLGLQN